MLDQFPRLLLSLLSTTGVDTVSVMDMPVVWALDFLTSILPSAGCCLRAELSHTHVPRVGNCTATMALARKVRVLP